MAWTLIGRWRCMSILADVFAPALVLAQSLTNDMGVEPLQIVLKLVSCNGQSVAKLSDSPGKTMCSDETFLAYLRQVFEVPAPERRV